MNKESPSTYQKKKTGARKDKPPLEKQLPYPVSRQMPPLICLHNVPYDCPFLSLNLYCNNIDFSDILFLYEYKYRFNLLYSGLEHPEIAKIYKHNTLDEFLNDLNDFTE